MTIKQLINQLKKHENQDAYVSIVVGNYDDNEIDTTDFEIHCLDVPEYVELFVFKK